MNYVYILPNDNYVGVSKNIRQRMAVHRCERGRDTSRLQIIKAFEDRREALDYERYLQKTCGYDGAYELHCGTNEKGCDPITPKRPIVLHGEYYDSLTEASKLTGRSLGYVHKHAIDA